jgi:hypothetical protein
MAMTIHIRALAIALGIVCATIAPAPATAGALAPRLSVAEARAIAKDAYLYGYSLVDSYRILHSYFVDRSHPEFKAPWNQLANTAHVYTPDDRQIQTPNSDTPYSFIGADLRAEPLVISVPAVEKGRYYALQFIDAYTFNFAYVGSRTTGNGEGRYLLAGPRWKGEKPEGVDSVLRSETELALVFIRTQLFEPSDLENVKKVQAGYKVQTLSAFLGTLAPARAPDIAFPAPLSVEQERTSIELFGVLNFVLQFCPTHPSEAALMERFARIGIGAGKKFDAQALPPDLRKAIEDGIADAWRAFDELGKRAAAGEVTSGDLVGSREFLKNNYLYRMRGTVAGIYGNSREEAIYPAYYLDSTGQKLDGHHRFTLRFAPGQLPPVNAFWSLTLYELPSRMLSRNPLHRYLINSPMLPTLERDADGGITLYVQHETPGKDKESNWLPAPDGPFVAALRLFWPRSEALNGAWKAPAMQRADRP